MSEVETASTGFRRGNKQRSSLPVVRTPSKTLERPLGKTFHRIPWIFSFFSCSSLFSLFACCYHFPTFFKAIFHFFHPMFIDFIPCFQYYPPPLYIVTFPSSSTCLYSYFLFDFSILTDFSCFLFVMNFSSPKG